MKKVLNTIWERVICCHLETKILSFKNFYGLTFIAKCTAFKEFTFFTGHNVYTQNLENINQWLKVTGMYG